ncbi:hypothetical protein RXV86_01545 [Alisedimentitalea sp. MJ-SS2]|uniref:hypothetical protein n=1 Tax=Aliisedimentitalea sp. MJ-SS2 TaxID=3049795 RepID=UPI00290788C1|nr:hypothetical protein [Alisedimentitalea sp. MJ-SS2]MDU8926060.1 hypothetical protein [Alisedimentitalea sp. MJ-SS2]
MVRDRGMTLRLTVLPWAVAMATVFAILELIAGLGLSSLGYDQLLASMRTPGYLPAIMISLFVVCTIGAWVGLSWHRHVLLGEKAVAVLPRNNSETFDPYFDAVMKFTALTLGVVMMIKYLMVPLVPVLGLAGPGAKVISVAINALLVTILLRHALILPAAALGKPVSMSTSWKVTSGFTGPIFSIAFVVVIVVETARMLPAGNLAALVLQFTAVWAGLILCFGVITELYKVRTRKLAA